MKRLSLLLTVTGLLLLNSCTKDTRDLKNEASFASSSTATTSLSKVGGGNNGGGGTTTTGFISSVGGVFKLVGGNSDSIQINLTQAAPAGWVLNLSSTDPSLQLPFTFPVPVGTFNVHIPVTSSVINTTTSVTITATLNGQTKSSAPFDVFPLHATFPAPKLQSPANGASFTNRLQVKFAWVDNANAYYHDIQISDSPIFAGGPMLEAYLDDPIWAASYFNGLGKRYWRVRNIDGSRTPGP